MKSAKYYKKFKFNDIPQGLTQKNVNRDIITSLINKNIKNCLDIPCGNGDFIRVLQRFLPSVNCLGVDINNPRNKDFNFKKADITQSLNLAKKYDLITSISGVTELYDSYSFICNLKKYLTDDGLLIITNDNSHTIKSRLYFLFFAKISRFSLLLDANSPTFKQISIAELLKILAENNLKLTAVRYTAFYYEDLIFLPLAIIIYPIQKLYLSFCCKNFTKGIKKKLFPFKSLFAKHYILYIKKK